MFQFIINLLYAPEEPESADLPPPRVPKVLAGGDKLSRRLDSYHASLDAKEKAMLDEILPELLRIGSNSRPPRDWQPFLRLTHRHRHERPLQHLSAEWWNILMSVLTAALAESPVYHKPARKRSGGGIDVRSLPVARGIIWLHLHLNHTNAPQLGLPLMAKCMENYPHQTRVYEEIALCTAYFLKGQPYFKGWRRRIPLEYPALMQGRLLRVFSDGKTK